MANLPIAYSEGFNPHQKMSFAMPLSLGMASVGEYIDIELKKEMDTQGIIDSLNEAFPEGLKILKARQLGTKEKTGAAITAAAMYKISLTDDTITQKNIDTMLQTPQIHILKKTKKKEQMIDIRPMIYSAGMGDNNTINLILAAGSELYLKPEMVVEYLYEGRNFGRPFYLREELLKADSTGGGFESLFDR